jgi:hypothetical protein
MITSEKIISKLYTAMANGETLTIEECYAPSVKFYDPVFGVLKGNDVSLMWKMLLQSARGKIKMNYTIIKSTEYVGSTRLTIVYNFGKNNRKIENIIHSEFHFKDGLIIKQNDDFDIWKWSKQAFGLSGVLFGWTGYMQKKINEKALLSLKKYKSKLL